MKRRWMLGALIALTALSTLHDAGFALDLSRNPSRYAAVTAISPCHDVVLRQHGITFALAKLAISCAMLMSWLAALLNPVSQPWLQLANRAFAGWLLFQVVLIWGGIAAVLQQATGFSVAPFSQSALHIVWMTELRWLLALFLTLPVLQLALGECASRPDHKRGRAS